MNLKRTKVYLGLPSTGSVIDSQAYLLREISEIYKDQVELVYPAECVRRIFHDYARNEIVEDFLQTDCDVLWFLDSDITPSKQVLDLVAIHKDKWQVAGATYPVFMKTSLAPEISVVFTVYKKNESSGNFGLADAPKSGQDFVDGLATGCLFIKREVFCQLSKPYFEFKFNPDSRELTEGEDLGFCRKLSNLGIKFFTDFELICKHQKNVDLLEVNNYAIEYANRQVLNYDAAIKEQINVIIKEATQKAYEQGLQEGIKGILAEIKKSQSPQSKLVLKPQGLIIPK